MPSPNVVPLGPGSLTIGETGTLVDFSCQITAATLAADVSADDPVVVLCGDSVPGARTYAYHISGTLYEDLELPSGIVYYTWDHPGETVPFTFIPSDEATGPTVTGELIIDPLDIGGDTAGENMTSDFDWSCVGKPLVTPPAGGAALAVSEDAFA